MMVGFIAFSCSSWKLPVVLSVLEGTLTYHLSVKTVAVES
jgi:hypothetical protein